jgi:hypothetical protein
LLPVIGAVLRAGILVLPASAHAGGAGEGRHATFALPPVSAGVDVKARLWGVVSVAKLAPDLAIKCEDSSSRRHHPAANDCNLLAADSEAPKLP